MEHMAYTCNGMRDATAECNCGGGYLSREDAVSGRRFRLIFHPSFAQTFDVIFLPEGGWCPTTSDATTTQDLFGLLIRRQVSSLSSLRTSLFRPAELGQQFDFFRPLEQWFLVDVRNKGRYNVIAQIPGFPEDPRFPQWRLWGRNRSEHKAERSITCAALGG